MVPKFMAWDKKYKMLMRVNQIDFLKGTAWLEADQGDHETRHTLTRCFDDVIFMQSTGLKDKNGVEIFEGDICKIQRIPSGMKPIFVVSDYIKEKLIFSKITILGQNSYEEQGGYTGNFLEVIGNRFENPELLEER